MRIEIDEEKYMSGLARGILDHLKRFLEEENLQKTTLIAEQNICGQRIDFSFPKLKNKVFIEVHGQQHFKPVKHWGGEKGLAHRKVLDRNKKELIEVNFPDSILIEFGYKKIKYEKFLEIMGESLDVIRKEDEAEVITSGGRPIRKIDKKKIELEHQDIKIRSVSSGIKVREQETTIKVRR